MPSLAPGSIPTFNDVAAAMRRLEGCVIRTPLLRAQPLVGVGGGVLLAKAETLQMAGAFKFRGAYNRLVQIEASRKSAGVVAGSSGNHAQGVAAAGKILGIPTTIVMPKDAPRIKIDNTRGYGAEVVLYDRVKENREVIAQALVDARGAVLVPAFDDPNIIAGQGTVAIEMIEQAQALGHRLDAVVVPVGGGGLIAGCSLALRELSPKTRIYGAEPAGFDDTVRSLRGGERVANAPGGSTLCDALMTQTPGDLTFPINRDALSDIFTVSDDMVLRAMAYAWRELKLVVEPGGAVALAAVLEGMLDIAGKSVAVVLSGGNVDPAIFARALNCAT